MGPILQALVRYGDGNLNLRAKRQIIGDRAMRLLLVEDDGETAGYLSRELSRSNHEVHVARDGRDALFMIREASYDAVILDRRLPLVDGITFLQRIRNERRDVPVIMLTALGALRDKVEGLDAGADDYLVKPVEIPELNARLNALLRRPAKLVESGILRTKTIEVDLLGHRAKRGRQAVDLPPIEFKILVELMRNVGNVVTQTMLLKAVWGFDFEPSTNIVATHIARLRTRLNIGEYRDAIRTVRGAGYSIREDA